MAASPITGLSFGIEMEMLIKPKSNKLVESVAGDAATSSSGDENSKNRNRIKLRENLARMMTIGGIPAGLQTRDYSAWTLADEQTLDEVDGYWRIEFISLILFSNEPWQEHITAFFDLLYMHCDIILTHGCSTHVHVSPAKNGKPLYYTIQQLRTLMKAISFYDEPITRIMPADRKNNQWAQSSLQGPKARPELKTAYSSVPSASWMPLFAIFDQVTMRPMVYLCFGQDRYVSWNFAHVTDACGSVEFRRPPGVNSAKDAEFWIAFTLGFVQNSFETDWDTLKNQSYYPSVGQLSDFAQAGVRRLGPSAAAALRRRLIEEDTSPATVYSKAELESIKKKKTDKKKKSK
ncbi:hypothetical protein F4777DRAFT_583719 [Nemania sp. FL0916]|nr:hypothetical protein F4777DRAFT_583719 [Nemania sp. FL0916]